jgi:hypothetical protein
VREWRIHIGAHKTASTHIQHVLGDLRPQLLAGGLGVLVPHQGLREAKLTSLASHRRRNRFASLAHTSAFTARVARLDAERYSGFYGEYFLLSLRGTHNANYRSR